MSRVEIPEGFARLMESIGLPDLPEALASGEPEVSVRLNRAKGALPPEGAEPVPWCAEGYYLAERPQFTLDPRLHQGLYYVQEGASMFHAWVAAKVVDEVGRPLAVLDACAAPGGKTTAVMSRLPEGSVMVANEFVPARAAILRENLVKWGDPSVIVTRADTAAFSRLAETFDLIVADVPCSGEGMMRKDPHAAAQWSPGLVAECAALQREIVSNLWPALRPGGYLVYSTCTFNRTEDEENVAWIISELGAEPVEIPVDPAWGITPGIGTEIPCCRFVPGRTRGEGLFVALLRKPGHLPASLPAPARARRDKREKKGGASKTPLPDLSAWLRDAERYTITATADRVTAFPTAHADLLRRVSESADVIHEGIPLATVKGRDLIPAHPLALSTALNPEAFPRVGLTEAEALDYLRGTLTALPDGTPRGFVLVTFGGHPLGWMKNLGTRANNLYPQPYRIKNL
ncbi:MAG: rRNA cytosine-C5-methyltransferase [Duncaniella sp.]|nr:rRNA cytosine-C5-methyltransferase [Duncaniella sp.]